jgi:hypothetical protein
VLPIASPVGQVTHDGIVTVHCSSLRPLMHHSAAAIGSTWTQGALKECTGKDGCLAAVMILFSNDGQGFGVADLF